MEIAGYFAPILIGISLGLIGGGGSRLVLLYLEMKRPPSFLRHKETASITLMPVLRIT